MAWIFSRKQTPTKPKQWKHILQVHSVDGKTLMWHFVRDKNCGPVDCWKPFVKWWFATDKPYYVINVPDRRIMLVRSAIKCFDLVVEEMK